LSQRDAFSKSNSQHALIVRIAGSSCGKYRQRTNCPKGMLSAKAIYNRFTGFPDKTIAVANIVKEQIVPKGCFQQKQFTTSLVLSISKASLWQISSKNKLSQRDAFSKSNSQYKDNNVLYFAVNSIQETD
jgi:hypothetical protein